MSSCLLFFYLVGFGINPFSSTTFDTLPRTVADALNGGWVLDTKAGNCEYF